MAVIKEQHYETKLSALHNVFLKKVRTIDTKCCYYLGYNKQGKRMNNFDGYYFNSEIKKIC